MRVVPLKVVPFKGPGGAELPDLHYSEAVVLIAKSPQGVPETPAAEFPYIPHVSAIGETGILLLGYKPNICFC